MNLDDLAAIRKLDTQDYLAEIDAIPERLAQAWELAADLPLPPTNGLANIVISATGAAATAAEMAAVYAAEHSRLPIIIQRGYGLPAFASGAATLFIACEEDGNAEETLDAFRSASLRGCTLLVITPGGLLAERAALTGCTLWRFPRAEAHQPVLAQSFAFLLAAFMRLGLLPAQDEALAEAVTAMKAQQENIHAGVPAANNPAKRYAGQLVGRWVTLYGSGMLGPVASHWKNQINRLAKAPANAETLPDANHSSLAGIINPADELLMPHTISLFLRAVSDHPRNIIRSNTTRQFFMVEGLNTDFYMALGANTLAQMWTAIHFGEYLAFYLAVAYGIQPAADDIFISLLSTLAAQK